MRNRIVMTETRFRSATSNVDLSVASAGFDGTVTFQMHAADGVLASDLDEAQVRTLVAQLSAWLNS